jgi:hypothetical protein
VRWRGRYPKTREGEDKRRFVRLVEEYSGWPDATRVSVSQLKYSLDHDTRTQSATPFKSHLNDLLAQTRQFALPSVSSDPEHATLLAVGPNTAETQLLSEAKHSSLLYHYRNRLVHEFRRPGYGMELSSDNSRPYYHSMSDADDVTTWELVYPLEWLSSLPPIVLRLAEDHDPYERRV